MAIFISWSGSRGREVANALRKFLPKVLNVEHEQCFVSSQIEKGTQWFHAVLHGLETAKVGIVCLTPERLDSTWLHFEAGALARQVAARGAATRRRRHAPVYTFLHGVDPGQLAGPLAAYQSTTADAIDMRRLIASIERACPDLRMSRNKAFPHAWAAFQADIERLRMRVDELIPGFENLFRRKTFNEPVHECTDQSWGERYHGARETLDKLASKNDLVRRVCFRPQADLFESLVEQLDGFVMDIKGLLLPAPRFHLTRKGEVHIRPPGIRAACERRRERINDLVCQVLDPNMPATDDAARFMQAKTFEQRKLLVHRLELAISQSPPRFVPARRARSKGRPKRAEVTRDDLRTAAESPWELDRIHGYLRLEYLHERGADELIDALTFVRLERERVAARDERPSLMPLHYAVRALKAAAQRARRPVSTRTDILEECDRVSELVRKRKLDAGRQVRDVIAEIRVWLGRRAGAHRPTD
jgi:hypothetical protein